MKNSLYSFLYNYLVGNSKKKDTRWWRKTWSRYIEPNKDKTISTTIHDERVHVNCGYAYPLYARIFRELNNPLLQLAYQLREIKEKPINIIDIGAAVGDTVLLIDKNVADAFNKVLCVDGDNSFVKYLRFNMAKRNYVVIEEAMLSDREECIDELVRIHAGTASAQGQNKTQAVTIDLLAEKHHFDSLELIKIDIDGYDGKALAGATALLKKFHPAIIFEWHPLLIQRTGNNFSTAFDVLTENGYHIFLFYTKLGAFSHFMFNYHPKEVDALASLCTRERFMYDWHYDVIALPHNTNLDIYELAECRFAKKKKSAY